MSVQKIQLGVSNRLINDDLAPDRVQSWSWYSIFAFWMSDVHSVGGYVFAASLFALGLAGWQVFLCLLIGITIVMFFANLMGKPGQQAGIPFPVVCRMSFGVLGANIPAIIRGAIAVVWYGIQTYLASSSFIVLMLYFAPGLNTLSGPTFLGLSYLGWIGFAAMWIIQAFVFMFGMGFIRKVIDWAGPAIYVAMIALCIYMIDQTGWSAINFSLSTEKLSGWSTVNEMVIAIVLVAGYFAGPTLNFSDFARYCNSYSKIKLANWLGLPVNFIVFSFISVTIVAASLPLFGQMITDPIETVHKLNSGLIIVLGTLTFIFATTGINIVANFVSPAFDFSNVAPQKISFKQGGFIAAVLSILIMPWNLFNNPAMIHYTVDILATLIGPIYGIILVDYFSVKKQKIDVDALYTENPQGRYWYQGGINKKAVAALICAGCVGVVTTFIVPQLSNYSLFISGLVAATSYWKFMAKQPSAVQQAGLDLVADKAFDK